MKLKTSYFNGTAFWKNITRFAPAWVLYTVILLLFMLADMRGSWEWSYAAVIADSIAPLAILNLGYAFLCAQLLFGDLYNSRLCNALHAMPLRREGWFFSNVSAGLAFSLIPNLLVAFLTFLLANQFSVVALLWLAAMTLQYLFFFGIAVLSAYCVGNRFAMVLVYGIINGFSLIACWLIKILYEPNLYGIEILEDSFIGFSPVAQMQIYDFVGIHTVWENGEVSHAVMEIGNGWGYLGICAVLGVAAIGMALLLYRKRNLECAGDLIAVKSLSPVFLVLYTLCGGAVCQAFFYLFFGEKQTAFLVVGLIVGFFTGRMLLDRTVRVFQKKNIIAFTVLLLCVAGSLILTRIDPLGITRWVPAVEEVESIRYYTGAESIRETEKLVITDKEQIENLIAVHRYGVESRTTHRDVQVYFTYTLKNGTERQRYYYIDKNSEAGQILRKEMNRIERVLRLTEKELTSFHENLLLVYSGKGDEKVPDPEQSAKLLEAIYLDCAEGNMAQDVNIYSDPQWEWLGLEYRNDSGQMQFLDLRVSVFARHTLAWMMNNGYDIE